MEGLYVPHNTKADLLKTLFVQIYYKQRFPHELWWPEEDDAPASEEASVVRICVLMRWLIYGFRCFARLESSLQNWTQSGIL